MPSDNTPLQQILQQLANGLTSVDQVTEKVRSMLNKAGAGKVDSTSDESPSPSPAPSVIAEPANLNIDLDRQTRCGYPEVIYGPGKSIAATIAAFETLDNARQNCLATRCSSDQLAALQKAFPTAIVNENARTVRLSRKETPLSGCVPVVTAGTSDLPVAEEALETLRWMNVATELITDVGVAGPQRFLNEKHKLAHADAVVVVAGMEGALPSVVAGWVNCPVIAVPTSVGYGAAFGGIAALLGMLNSCAANVAVVNIDAGFKAGYLSGLMAQKKQKQD